MYYRAIYSTIDHGAPFNILNRPGTLTVTAGPTCGIAFAKKLHTDSLKSFQLYQLIQWALIQHIIGAIEPKYLITICNRITGQVLLEICMLILHLFSIYGEIMLQQSRNKYDGVEQVRYDISELIDTVSEEVDDVAEILDIADRPYSPQQISDLGYINF